MSKVTPMFPDIMPKPVPPVRLWEKCDKCAKRLAPEGAIVHGAPPNLFAWDRVDHVARYEVCSCTAEKPLAENPVLQSFFDKWLNSVQDLSTTLERAKLRHEIKEALTPDLKPFSDILGLLVDPAGVISEMAQRYWAKEAAEKRARAADQKERASGKRPRRAKAPTKRPKKKGPRR